MQLFLVVKIMIFISPSRIKSQDVGTDGILTFASGCNSQLLKFERKKSAMQG